MSRLRTHGRTNMWKYSAWAESAIFNIGVDFHWCVENNNDALRMARLLCEAISNALWSQYQRLSEQTISMLCPRLSSASSPWLASPHCNTTHTDVQLWSKCSNICLQCNLTLVLLSELRILPQQNTALLSFWCVSSCVHAWHLRLSPLCFGPYKPNIFWKHMIPLSTDQPTTHSSPSLAHKTQKNTNLDFSPLYDILHQTNHKFSESMWHLLSTVALMAQVALFAIFARFKYDKCRILTVYSVYLPHTLHLFVR